MSKPRPRSGPAFETSSKEDFRNKLRIRVDFSDYTISIRQVKQEMKKLNAAAKKNLERNNGTNKGFGIYIQSNDELFASQQINRRLPGGGGELSSFLSKYLTNIGQYGKEKMQNYTRIDTGLMKSSVGYQQRRMGDKYVTLDIGWVRRWYQYFGWQEEGTSMGIKPMNAILRTRAEVLPYAQQEFSKAFTKYFLK